jgi:hypothetical protein
MTCVRRAWLTLDTLSVPLESVDGGWFCTSLDLGYPEVRDVVNNRPDQNGVDDRTRYWGARAVTAELVTDVGWGAQIDQVAAQWAPFMVPSARPVLHYVLDRPGTAERTLTLRAAAYDWKIEGDRSRTIQLQWVAADPIVRDPVTRTATAWAGAALASGRTYDLTFPRTYPAGGGIPTTSIIHGYGDVPIQPLLRIYGPITGPKVTIHVPGGATYVVGFLSTFAVGTGAWVDVNTANKTALYQSDPNQNVITSLDWSTLTWPVLPPGVDNTMTLSGGATSDISQVQAIWQDGYLE